MLTTSSTRTAGPSTYRPGGTWSTGMRRSAATRQPRAAPRRPAAGRSTRARAFAPGLYPEGATSRPRERFASGARSRPRLAASRGVAAEPAGGLPRGPLIPRSHLHAPREDAPALAIHGALAEGYARRPSEFRVDVFGIAGEDVDDAHVVLLFQQARLRRADLEQREAFSLAVSLSEVAEQLALVVGDEAVLDPSPLADLAYR